MQRLLIWVVLVRRSPNDRLLHRVSALAGVHSYLVSIIKIELACFILSYDVMI